nr:aldehyde dehydrogenase family protein [Sphingomonas sp. Y57]
MSQIEPLIDGRSQPSSSMSAHPVINPSTGTNIFELAEGSAEDIDAAVAAARRAYDDERWWGLALPARKAIMLRWAELVRTHQPELDRLDAEEMGKPVSVRLFGGASAADLLQFHAEAIDKLRSDVFNSDSDSFVTTRISPRGVVGAIVPWNFPTFNALLKIGPALAAGNSVVLKPSELASRSALRVAELAHEAGLPSGVLNVVTGLGETTGKALALHMDVDMIAFTGSSEVGRLMQSYAGQSNMKVVLAECGGKSPQIVFEDADIEAAAQAIAGFILTNSGQTCSVGSRVLVQRSIEDAFVERLRALIANFTMGEATHPETTFGPLATARQRDRVREFLDGARREGATVHSGDRASGFENGSFIDPAIVQGVSPFDPIAQEELFGPVLTILPFDGEDDAIRIANATIFGLIAYVWTRDIGRAFRIGKRVRSSVQINAAAATGFGAGHAAPFEPARQSGVGKEGGIPGLESYIRHQLFWINHG